MTGAGRPPRPASRRCASAGRAPSAAIRQSSIGDELVGAVGPHGRPTVRQDGVPLARAPPQAVVVTPGDGHGLDVQPGHEVGLRVEAAEPHELLAHHGRLEVALRGERDVLEVAARRRAPGRRRGTEARRGRRSGTSTRTASPRQNRSPSVPSVISTTTRSPGRAWRTNTTRDSGSGSRATQWPPWATGPTSTSKRSPTRERPRARRGRLWRAEERRGVLIRRRPVGWCARGRGRGAGRRRAPGPRRARTLLGDLGGPQLVGHGDDHDTRGEEQAALEPQRRLVVEQLLPPAPDDVLRDVDRHDAARAGPADLLGVLHDRAHDLAVGRVQDLERDVEVPVVPLLQQPARGLGVDADVDRLEDVGPGGAGEGERPQRRLVQLGRQHDRVDPGRHDLVLLVGRELELDARVVASDGLHEHEEEPHRQDRDPRSGEELGDQHDHQDDGGHPEAEGVDGPRAHHPAAHRRVALGAQVAGPVADHAELAEVEGDEDADDVELDELGRLGVEDPDQQDRHGREEDDAVAVGETVAARAERAGRQPVLGEDRARAPGSR